MSNAKTRLSPSIRRGFTLLEVLFCILILTIGLLSVVALFPVAARTAQRGVRNDMATVATDAAAHLFDTAGMRQPANWIAYVDSSPAQATAYPGPALRTSPVFWKTSFCIDPRFTAANIAAHAPNEQRWTEFPAFPKATPTSPRMQRLTLASAGPGSAPMGRFVADRFFIIEDEPLYHRPKDETVAPWQTYGYAEVQTPTGPQKVATRRDDAQELSWLATLVPKIDRNNATLPDRYVLSIVVFYERGLGGLTTRDFNQPPPAGPFVENRWPDHEWTVAIDGADFYSDGFGGGDVRLNADAREKLNIKEGSWLMLAGNANGPEDSSGNPIAPFSAPAFAWYRVSDIDDIDTATIGGVPRYVRNVTLIGPDWDRYDVDKDGARDATEVFVLPDIVNVSERTVSLEF